MKWNLEWIIVALIAIALALIQFEPIYVAIGLVIIICITCAYIWINRSVAILRHSENPEPVTSDSVEYDGEEETPVPPAGLEEIKVPEEKTLEVDTSSLVTLGTTTVYITNQQDSLQLTQYGLSLDIPENSLQEGINQVALKITWYYVPVFFSCLYHFQLDTSVQALQQPITLTLDHCVTDGNNKYLTFFRSTDGKIFKELEGGCFEGKRGKIQRSTFSWFSIGCSIKDFLCCRNISYTYLVYLKLGPDHICCNMFEIAFSRTLEAVIMRIKEDYDGDYLCCTNFRIDSENTESTLRVTVDDNHQCTKLLSNEVIRIEDMDRAEGRGSAPKLTGEMHCENDDNCHCILTLEGTDGPSTILVPCSKQTPVHVRINGEAESCRSTANPKNGKRRMATDGGESDEETAEANSTNLADLMNGVASKIAAKWKDVGIQLGLSPSTLDSIQNQNAGKAKACQESFIEVLTEWEAKQPKPYTWQTMIDALRSNAVGEDELAEELGLKYLHI